jgi:hypothetical protein
VAAPSSNSLLDGRRSGTLQPRIAMQRIWTVGKINVAWGLKFYQHNEVLLRELLLLLLLSFLYLYWYTYISIDFCHKSKEQRLKATKNAYNVEKY